MSELTTTLGLVIPEAPGANPNEAFDWNEFIRENFLRIDGMSIVGNTLIVNAASYIDSTSGLFSVSDLKSDMADYIAEGLLIYFKPGTYFIANDDNPTVGLEFGADGGVGDTYGSIHIIAAKGAIISTQGIYGTGDQIVNILKIVNTDNVVITDLGFIGKTDTVATDYSCAIKCENVKNLRIKGVDISQTCYGIVVKQSAGIESENCWIQNCNIKDFNGDAIRLDQVINAVVQDNYIARLGAIQWPGEFASDDGHAINVIPGISASGTPNSIKILNNSISMPRRNGVYIQHTASEEGSIYVIENVINQPGNHPSVIPYTDEVTKATRGSGIFSTFTGNLIIKDNVINGPIAFAVYVANASMPTVENNVIDMSQTSRDVGLIGQNWHGIYLLTSDYGKMVNNQIIGVWGGHSTSPLDTPPTEYRMAIKTVDSSHVNILGNLIDNWGIHVYGCSYANICGNNIESITGYPIDAIKVQNETGHFSISPLIMNNNCHLVYDPPTTCYGIRLIGTPDASSRAVVIGNAASVCWGYEYDDAGAYIWMFGNTAMEIDPEGHDLLTTPEIAIDRHGRLKGGEYTENRFFPAHVFMPGANCSLALDDVSKMPSLVFADAGIGYAYLTTDFINFLDNADENDLDIEVWFSTKNGTVGKKAIVGLSYFLTSVPLFSAGAGTIKPVFTDLGDANITNLDGGLEYVNFTIPHADADAGRCLTLRIKRDPTNGNDDLNEVLYVHGIRANWIATYPTA